MIEIIKKFNEPDQFAFLWFDIWINGKVVYELTQSMINKYVKVWYVDDEFNDWLHKTPYTVDDTGDDGIVTDECIIKIIKQVRLEQL